MAMAEAKSRKGRAPRRLTAQSLDNAALHYLERFAASSAHLRRILLRKVARAAEAGMADRGEGARLVEELIERYLAAGLLDDRAYAAQKGASLHRRGTSRYGIGGQLAKRGVPRELIAATLGDLADSGSDDLAAACALVRRRRLGPYRPAAERETQHRRDLAALARAGFSRDVARRVLAAPDPATLERLARGEEPE